MVWAFRFSLVNTKTSEAEKLLHTGFISFLLEMISLYDPPSICVSAIRGHQQGNQTASPLQSLFSPFRSEGTSAPLLWHSVTHQCLLHVAGEPSTSGEPWDVLRKRLRVPQPATWDCRVYRFSFRVACLSHRNTYLPPPLSLVTNATLLKVFHAAVLWRYNLHMVGL